MNRRRRACRAVLLAGLVGAAAVGPARAAEVLVAVAANFAAPLTAIAADFKAATGHTVIATPGATGKLATQIAAGAPFDVLLAADETTPARLMADGHAVAGSAFPYAIGRLVLWSAQPRLVDAQGAVLAREGAFTKLAVANPRTAPYGRAAMEVLAARGLAQRLAPKLVTGQNVAQAWQFVASGNAELGFVARSQLPRGGDPFAGGSWWEVPAALHTPIRQDAVLLVHGRDNPAAGALLDFLRGDAARRRLRAFGYGEPAP
jgi:molybdate transport system substrate-binding protein